MSIENKAFHLYEVSTHTGGTTSKSKNVPMAHSVCIHIYILY